MKTKSTIMLGAILASVTWGSSMAATEAEKLQAIQEGLANLYASQQADGSWDYRGGAYNQSATGAAVLAFMSQQAKWGALGSQYQTAVDKAIGYLLSTATTTAVSTRNDSGCSTEKEYTEVEGAAADERCTTTPA